MNKTQVTLATTSVLLIVLSYIVIEYSYTYSVLNYSLSALLYIVGMSLILYNNIYTEKIPMDYKYIRKKRNLIVSWLFYISLGMYLHLSGFVTKSVFFITWVLFGISLSLFSYLSSRDDENMLRISQAGNILVIFSIFLFVYFRKRNIFRPSSDIDMRGLNIALLFYSFGWAMISYSTTSV